MQAVAGNRLIGAGHDRNSGLVQRPDDLHFFLEYFFDDLRTIGRRSDIGELLGKFGSDLVDAGLEAGGRFRGGCGKEFR